MPTWLNNAIFYEIYPQSFCDTNSDGIGDLQGIIKHLDYITELGANAIWLNPCFESPFADAGYDISNFCKVAPRYGTNDDLKELFEKAHDRGLHVILDLVPGHTSIDHPWFLESKKDEKNEFSNRYIWNDSVWNSFEGFQNISGSLRGIFDRNACCAINFFSSQPALNYGFANPTEAWQSAPDSNEALQTRQAMKDIMEFWLTMGCDGFRVDMAGSLVKNDETCEETIKLWQDIRAFIDTKFPEAALVSEWGEPEKSLKSGFHMDFQLHFGPSHYMDLFRENPFFSRNGKGDVSKFAEKYWNNYQATNGEGLICIPSGNHDMHRLKGTLDEEEIKLVFAFLNLCLVLLLYIMVMKSA
jgi:Glycosidases